MKHHILQIFFALLFFTNVAFSQEYEVYATLSGHSGQVQNLRFSPDGTLVATTGKDGQVILWNTATGAMVRQLTGFSGMVYEATFSFDGKYIAAGGHDGSARVWEVASGKNVGTYLGKMTSMEVGLIRQHISFVCFSQDNKTIYFGGDAGFIMEANIASAGQPSVTFATTNRRDGSWYSSITGGCLSHDGKSLLVSVGDYVQSFNITTRTITKSFFYETPPTAYGGLNDVVIVPDGKTIATWAFDGNVLLWDYKSGDLVKKIRVTDAGEYSAATFNADASLMATAAFKNMARVWDMKTDKEIQTLRAHARIIRTIRFSPVADILGTASSDGTAKLWKKNIPEKEKDIAIVPEKDVPPIKDVPIKNPDETKPIDTKPIETTPDGKGSPSFDHKDLVEGATINLKNIQFEQSTPHFLPTSFADLDKLLEVMSDNPKMKVKLLGHTDNQGSKIENYKLSISRVEAVKKFLVEKGVDEKRIEIKGWGPDKPITDNRSEETRRSNRRVEVVIVSLK